MAKVTGPLMSMDASGKFGGKLVFSKWKGRNTVRNLVTPANPQNSSQTAVRNAVRAIAAGQAWINLNTTKQGAHTLTDKALLTAAAPSGQAWNGFFVKSGIGAGSLHYSAATTAFAALSSGQKTAWDTAAAALTPAILSVNQSNPFGVAGTPMRAGEVYFHAIYAEYIAGICPVPTGTPPTYA